ncbi:hypothetical protein ACW73L_19510 [Methylolobus aquaticus]
MTDHQSDAILFLRLAGTRFGVRSRHIPETLISTVADFGGRVSFEGDRVFVGDPKTALHRLQDLAGRESQA